MKIPTRVLCVFCGTEGPEEHSRLRTLAAAARSEGVELWFLGPRDVPDIIVEHRILLSPPAMLNSDTFLGAWLFSICASVVLPLAALFHTLRLRPRALVTLSPSATLLAFPASLLWRAPLSLFVARIPWFDGTRQKRLSWIRSLLYFGDCFGILAAHHVVVPTESMKQAIVAEAPFIKQYITILSHGLFTGPVPTSPEEVTKRRKTTIINYNFPERAFVIFTQADLHFREPLESLLHAIAGLDEDRICLLVMGEGKERITLASIAAGLAMPDRVVFLPQATVLPETISGVDLVLLLKEYGMPDSVVHALGCGIPVLGTTSGSLPEILGPSPLLVPPGDTEALSQRIYSLVRSRETLRQARELTEKAAKKYSFSWGSKALQIVLSRGIY